MVQVRNQQGTRCSILLPSVGTHQSDSLAEYDEDNLPGLSAAEIRAIVNENHNNIRMQELRDHAKMDETYIQLKATILKGFPDHNN